MLKKIVFFACLLILLVLIGLMTIELLPKDVVNLKPEHSFYDNFSSYNEEMQFYPNMRFAKAPITYSQYDCKERENQQFQNAFSIIELQSGLGFKQEDNGEIKIFCGQEAPKVESNTFVAGEGGPKLIVNTGLYYVILDAEVYIFKSLDCNQPIVELHELLHALGFEHSTDERSLMYNYSSCDQVLTPDISKKLKELYAQEALPDLYFGKVEAQTEGRYLNFKVEIKNRGLSKAQTFKLSVYSSGSKIKDFDIGEIDLGEGRILEVENLKAAGLLDSIKAVRFRIDEANTVREISETNNEATLAP